MEELSKDDLINNYLNYHFVQNINKYNKLKNL